MTDKTKTKAELMAEVQSLREQVTQLEATISAQRDTIETLRQSEAFCRNVVNKLDDPIFVKDAQHRWVMINDKNCELIGASYEEIIGKSDYDFFPKEQADTFWYTDHLALMNDTPIISEETVTWHDEVRTISTKKSILTDPKTGDKFIVGTSRDITDHKRLEQALRQSQTELEKQVMARTSELIKINADLEQEISQRKHTEQNLSNIVRRFWALIEHVGDVFAIMDADLIFRYVSHSLPHVLGYQSSHVIGRAVYDLIHPHDLSHLQNTLTKILEKPGASLPIELQIRHSDGTWRVVEGMAKNLISDPVIDGVIINFRDITNRKRAEEALRQSEERYRIISEIVPDYAYAHRIEPNGMLRLEWVTDAFYQITGYTWAEIKAPDDWRKLFHSDDMADAQKHLQHVLAGHGITAEIRIITKSGEVRWLQTYAKPVWDASQSRVVRIYGASQDITERKLIEQELRESETKFRTLAETTAAGIFIYQGSRFAYVNKAAIRQTGYSNSELLELNFWDFVHPDSQKAIKERGYARQQGQVGSSSHEVKIVTKHGDIRHLYYNANRIDYQGKPAAIATTFDITERKLAEQALQQREIYFRSLIENTSDIITILEEDGTISYQSPSIERILGYTSTELLGCYAFDLLIHPDDVDRALETFNETLHSAEVSLPIQFRFRHRDGTWRVLEAIGQKFPPDLALSGVVVNSRDITERQQAEQSLRENEAKFRTLAETTTAATVIFREKFLYVNPATEAITGYGQSELRGMSFWELIHPDFQDVAKENGLKLLQGEPVSTQYELKILTKDGELRWLHFTGGLITFEGQSAIIGTAFDITERKRAEQELYRHQQLLRAIIDNTSTIIYVKDLRGRYLLANKQLETVFNLSQADIINKTDDEIFPAPYAADFQKNDQIVLESGQPQQFEEAVTHEYNALHTYVSVKFPLWDSNNQLYGMAGISTDITDRKRVEDALEKMTQRYRTLFDEAPAMYVITRTQDKVPVIVDANQQFLNSLGYNWSEVYEQPLVDFYTPNSEARLWEDGYEQALVEHFAGEERELVTRNGRILQTMLQAMPETDSTGQIIGKRAMYIDITESKQLQERLVAIHQLGRELTLIRDECQIIQQVLETAQLVLRCNYTACGLIDHAADQLHLHYYVDQGLKEQHHLYLPLHPESDPRGITVTVAQSGQALRVGDVRQDARFIETDFGWNSRSELCVPMKVGERIIGVLDAESEKSDHFTLEDQRILQILADQTAVSLENAWLHAETEWRAKELVVLNKAGRIMASSLNLNTVMAQALAEIKDLLAAEGVSLLLLDPMKDELVFTAAASPGTEAMLGLRLPLTTGIAGWAATHKESVLIEDAQQDDRFYKSVDTATGLTTHSLIAVPLISKEQVVGVIESINKAEGLFDQQDLELLEALASSAVIAIENARLHSETQQSLQAQTALRETAMMISSTLDLDTVLYRITEQMCRLVDVTSVYISRYEATALTVTPIAEYISSDAHPQEKETDIGVNYVLQKDFDDLLTALETGQHLITHVNDPYISQTCRQHLQQYAAQTVLDIPMRVGGQTIAYTTLWESRQRRDFTFEEINLCYDLAQHAAIAMENARLHTETQQRLTAQTTLRKAVEAIFSSLEMNEVLQHISRHIGEAVAATRVSLCSYEPKNLQSTVLAEYISPQASQLKHESVVGITCNLQQNSSTIIDRLQQVESWLVHTDDPNPTLLERKHIKKFNLKTILIIPLKLRGRLIAFAEIWETRQKREFSQMEISLCQDIAQQAVVAIENARLHAETERRAKQLSVLHELDQAITASLDIQEVYRAFAQHSIRLIAYDRLSIALIEGDQLRLVYIVGPDETVIKKGLLLPLVGSAAEYVIKHEQALVRQDISQDQRFLKDKVLVAEKIRASLVLPLRNKGQVIGTLNMGAYRPAVYNLDDIQIAQSMADQLAIVIENIHLLEAETIQRQRTQALQAAGTTISSTLNLHQVLDQLLVELGKVIPYDSASVFLLEEDILRITMARSLPDSSPIGQEFEPNELARIVEQTRRPLILTDARRDSRFQRWAGAKHVRGWMNVPLIARDTFIGHITLDSRRPAAFSQTDADLALSFANQAAMAVENARLFQNLQKQMHILEETQGQLIQSESMAALGRLSASIAHEINNPLQAIQSGLLLFKEKVNRDLQDNRLMNYLEIAEQEIDRISAIMHRMRNFYLSAGKTQPTSPPSLDLLNNFYRSVHQDLRSVDLQAMLESELKLVQKHIEQRSITLECHWQPGLPPIQGNPDHLQQVFLNLIMNALEAMTNQGGVLVLKSAIDQIDLEDAQSLPVVRIEVSDTGSGIPPDQLERLFEQFYSTKENGSGLGLFISHKIIEAHNGQIIVESRPGLGTTFSVLLPIEQS